MWLLLACADPVAPVPPTRPPVAGDDDDDDAHTGTWSEATCRPREVDATRADCLADRPATWAWTSAGEAHELREPSRTATLWGLAPDTETRWTAELGDTLVRGAFRTPPAPVSFEVVTTGHSTVPHVLLNATCDQAVWVMITSTDGTLRWLASSADSTSGYSWDPPDGVLFAVERATVERMALDGTRLSSGPFERPIHHDLAREPGGERLAVINAQVWDWSDGQQYVIDGFYLLDGRGRVVATWDLEPLLRGLVPEGPLFYDFWDDEFPGAGDWTHTNNVTWAPDGDLVLSVRYLDLVVKVAGPDSPEPGAVRWLLAGSGSPLPSDLALSSAVPGGLADFDGQHHATLHDDGTLTLFDNGPPGRRSRALTFAIDEAARTAVLVQELELPHHCNLIGGTYRMADGGSMVTCADHQRAWEFGPDGVERWSLEVTCPTNRDFNVNHVIPVTLP
jgi:hypothetical protein